jgi:hypothetical protein
MFWISVGSILLIFFSGRAYLNNSTKWRGQKFLNGPSRIYFYLLQTGNILIIVAGISLLMLAIVCQVKGYEIHFSSDYLYHIRLITN